MVRGREVGHDKSHQSLCEVRFRLPRYRVLTLILGPTNAVSTHNHNNTEYKTMASTRQPSPPADSGYRPYGHLFKAPLFNNPYPVYTSEEYRYPMSACTLRAGFCPEQKYVYEWGDCFKICTFFELFSLLTICVY